MFGRKKKPKPLEFRSETLALKDDAGYRPPLKVAILGGAAKEKYFTRAQYDHTWEIWGLNSIRPDQRADQSRWAPIRWARMFNLHRFEHLNRDAYQYLILDMDWSKNNPRVPMCVVDSWHGLLANEHLFQREELRTLSPRGGRYHAGSFDMLVAYALFEGATEIVLHGICLALDSARSEPISARACLEYWCGVAEGRGVMVVVQPDCDIFRQYHLVASDTTYGFDDVKLVVEARDLHKNPATYGPLPKDEEPRGNANTWSNATVEPK